MQKAYYDILGTRHCQYSNLQINKVSSVSHYSKYQLELITYKILMDARQLSRRGSSSDGRSNLHVQTITITTQITFNSYFRYTSEKVILSSYGLFTLASLGKEIFLFHKVVFFVV